MLCCLLVLCWLDIDMRLVKIILYNSPQLRKKIKSEKKENNFFSVLRLFIYRRLKSSPVVSGINKLDGSFEPASSDACTAVRNELERAPFPRDRTVVLEQRLLAKGNKKYAFTSWHAETQISSQGFATSDFSVKTSSLGTNGVDNNTLKFKRERECFISIWVIGK
jgi:hypothetical protein